MLHWEWKDIHIYFYLYIFLHTYAFYNSIIDVILGQWVTLFYLHMDSLTYFIDFLSFYSECSDSIQIWSVNVFCVWEVNLMIKNSEA